MHGKTHNGGQCAAITPQLSITGGDWHLRKENARMGQQLFSVAYSFEQLGLFRRIPDVVDEK